MSSGPNPLFARDRVAEVSRADIDAYLLRGRMERARAIQRALRRLTGRR